MPNRRPNKPGSAQRAWRTLTQVIREARRNRKRAELRPRKPAIAIRLRCRGGFTLVELLVSLVLLDIALLALVASTALAARQLADARARSAATAAAQSRIEWAVTVPCGEEQIGSAPLAGGGRETWSVSAPANGVRVVRDSIEFRTGRATVRYVFESRSVC